MGSTPDRSNRHARGSWSKWRRWGMFLGALILFLVGFELLDSLVEPGARPGAEVARGPATPLEPVRPEVTKLDPSGVRVVVEGGHRITEHLDDEAEADRLIACIEEGIATSLALTEGEADQPPESDGLLARNVRAKQVWKEVLRNHNGCTMDIALAPPDDRP